MRKLKMIKIGIVGVKILFILTLTLGVVLYLKNKNNIEYQEGTNVTYGIKMLDGTVYSDEDKKAVKASEIEKITVNIEYYNTDSQVKENGYTISAYITTYINSTISNEALGVLMPREIVKNNEKVISNIINVTYEINYNEKINEINEYIASQKLEGKVSSGVIELSLVSGKEKEVINISLLNENLSIVENNKIDNVVKESNIFSILIMGGSTVVIAICVCLYLIIHKFESLNAFEQEKIKIFKFNKDILVEGVLKASDVNSSTIVNSFKELLKIQRMVSLPIIYEKSELECKFVIKAGTNKYLYVLKNKVEN